MRRSLVKWSGLETDIRHLRGVDVAFSNSPMSEGVLLKSRERAKKLAFT